MKLLSRVFLIWLIGVGACRADETTKPATPAAAIASALANPLRPAADRKRDGDRKPGKVLAFFGVGPGMQAADMMAGGGSYTEILSRALGEKGKVYAQNNAVALGKFAAKAMDKRFNGRDLKNVVRLDRELEDPGLPGADKASSEKPI